MPDNLAQPRHDLVDANGVQIHYARMIGGTRTLVLLHGWPEFWLTWLPVMQRLAARGYDVVAPDLRGFGDSEKPNPLVSDAAGADVHAADMVALLDALNLDRVGLVSHDVGAYAAQVLGRKTPQRFAGLFFFNCPYPGIGARWTNAEQLNEIWYQSFNQQPWAAELIGSSRESCRIYIGHFLAHWAGGNPHAFDDVLDDFVDKFLEPGNLQGGFNWYRSQHAARMASIRGEIPPQNPITVPTCVRWGDRDPNLPYPWADRLTEHFTDLDLQPFSGSGHFPHREHPDRAAQEIGRFFDTLAW
jgi:pimeloyl-ACP methyl ester carboxylesterase